MPPPPEAFGHAPLPVEENKKRMTNTMGPPGGAEEDCSDDERCSAYPMTQTTNGHTTGDLVRKYGGVSGVEVDLQTYENMERDSIRRHAHKMLDMANENGSTSSSSDFSSDEGAPYDDMMEKDVNFAHEYDDIVPSSRRSRRVPAALAGINYRSTTQERSYGLSSTTLPALPPSERARRFRDMENGFEDEHLDSIPISMMHNVRYQDDVYNNADGEMSYSDSMESKAYNVYAASKGSRFNRDYYVNNQKATLDQWDREHDNENKGGALVWINTYRSKRGAKSNKNHVFGPGFVFRKNHVYGRQQHDYANQAQKQREQLRIAWQDPTDTNVYEPSSNNGGAQTWKEVTQDRQKRRWCALFMCFFCFLIIFIPILTEVILAEPDMCPGCDIGDPVSIYAMSDTPNNMEDAKEVFRSITLLDQDADFLVHLGNVQARCDERRYDMTADLFKRSSLPTFAVPGSEDWLDCFDPAESLNLWRERFVDFEQNFDFDGRVYRNEDYPENFAVVRSGVLFVGLHMVSGPSVDPDEWEERRVSMLKFYFGMANMNRANFRAVVLMGNSSEKPELQPFFKDFFKSLEPIGKPVLYLHANDEEGTDGVIYQPFPEHPTLFSVQVTLGNAATRVDIGKGNTPFSIAALES
ncbi:unnamed protein product [Cylindrotheca closterium]|uniref:Calcineurin-like phosphoesterase domain-containing protein n=1 Tax=Cylindrotheca closterium TaxID=2856 RepID=A0AAD2CV22_9STRA|nr:unnamed protein product [Cylindrotheca closterium]